MHAERTSDNTFSGKDTMGHRREGVGDLDNTSPPHYDEDEDPVRFSWTPKTRSIFYRILLEKKFDPVGKLISKIGIFGFYPETNRP